MNNKIIYITAILFIGGCSITRHLSEDEKLYTGAEIRIKSKEKIPEKRALLRELNQVVRPASNDKFLGLFPYRLWLYTFAGKEVDRGVRGWIKNRLGQPPVLFEQANPENMSILMVNRLQNQGYFNADVEYEIRQRKRTAGILYTLYPNNSYRLKNIHFPEPGTELEVAIHETRGETTLREGDVFKLSALREERERIDRQLKNKGFYYFNANYIFFQADSTIGENKVNLYLSVREDVPKQAYRRFHMKNIYLYPDYALDRDAATAAFDTVHSHHKFIIQHDNRFRPDVLAELLFLESDKYYNRQDHLLTMNRLMGLGTFRFINMRFHQWEDSEEPLLDVHIYLTPVNEHSLRAEFRAISKSNDLAGLGFSTGYRNRNLFGGAESFTADIHSSFETQFGSGQRGLDLYQLSMETALQTPNIIAPIPLNARTSLYVPRTRIRVGYDILDRIDYLRINSLSARFGYVWMSSRHVRQEFNPIGIHFFQSTIASSDLRDRTRLNPSLRRSLESQFIIGTTYSLFFNNQKEDRWQNHLYFNFNLELSGHTMNLFQSLFRAEEASANSPYTVFGIPYSQYTRADIDMRYYLRTGHKSQIVTRLIAGAGVAYLNSRSIPYVKQFSSGGSSSVRAFPARSIGPGTYPPSQAENGFLTDRTGDILVEANVEYRFPLVSVWQGAFFIDAGNIWMGRKNGDREGTTFDFDTFLGELAVGTGFGLRLDASFFVLRFDIAFPLRTPYLPAGKRWVVDDINLKSSQWRRDNLAFNIAIGYPF